MRHTFISLLFILSGLYLKAQGYQPGDRAADFSLTDVSGKQVSMQSYPDAKGFILVFTCNSCPYSVAYEDRIIALHQKFAPKGYPVIAINPNDSLVQPKDSYQAMKQRAKEKSFPFAYVLDPEQKYANIYGATRTPHVFVVQGKAANAVVKYIGAIDNNSEFPEEATEHYVDEAVEALLKGNDPVKSGTKAIGCSIKRTKTT